MGELQHPSNKNEPLFRRTRNNSYNSKSFASGRCIKEVYIYKVYITTNVYV